MSDLPFFSINKKIIDSQSMGADIVSEGVDIAELGGYCFHAIWTGTAPSGNIIIQVSNDNSNFVDMVTHDTEAQDGQLLLNVERAHYRYVRAFYDRTSGTGTLNSYISGKRV